MHSSPQSLSFKDKATILDKLHYLLSGTSGTLLAALAATFGMCYYYRHVMRFSNAPRCRNLFDLILALRECSLFRIETSLISLTGRPMAFIYQHAPIFTTRHVLHQCVERICFLQPVSLPLILRHYSAD